MKTRKIWFELLVLVIILGIAVFGCKDDPNDENINVDNNVSSVDSALNVTWVSTSSYGEIIEMILILNNGTIEETIRSIPNTKGTYTTSGGKIIITTTHVYGTKYGLDSKWYSKNELESALKSKGNLSDQEIAFSLETLFVQMTLNYSVNGNILTINVNGEVIQYTRK